MDVSDLIQASLDASAAPVMEELRQKYLIGDDPDFPDKRVVVDPKDSKRLWDLNDIRIRVWAAQIVSLLRKYFLGLMTVHSFKAKQRSTSIQPLHTFLRPNGFVVRSKPSRFQPLPFPYPHPYPVRPLFPRPPPSRMLPICYCSCLLNKLLLRTLLLQPNQLFSL